MRFRNLVLGVMLAVASVPGAWGADWRVIADPSNSLRFLVLSPEGVLTARIGIIGWGPGWAWTSVESRTAPAGGVLEAGTDIDLAGRKVRLGLAARTTGPRTFRLTYRLTVPADTPLTALVVTIEAGSGQTLAAELRAPGGGLSSVNLPAGIGDRGTVSALSLGDKAKVQVQLTPALPVTTDGALRLILARDVARVGTSESVLNLSFPGEVAFLGGPGDLDLVAPVVPGADWFAYQPGRMKGPSVIGLDDWLEKPAGLHGGVRMVGDRFQFEDGTPVWFWGTNLSYRESAPDKAAAEETAARFARSGVNAVRLHKFTGTDWEGIGDPATAVRMDPAGLDRLDYFSRQLSARGLYYGWSHTFQFKVRPGDKARLSGFDELMRAGGNSYAVINWAEDVQDLMIEMVVNLLKHKNPYTGKTYAEDPALSFVELQNEDDIFFYTSDEAFRKFPTYAAQLEKRFAVWLKEKYGTQSRLASAWGGLKGGEGIEAGRVGIQANPWFMSSDFLPQQTGGALRRLLDNAAFLHSVQNKFYERFTRAIRAAGYQGPVTGSPWQAPGQLPHYLNLKSDALVGFIDRHNYFGGHLNDTMLGQPGSGYLASGLQQVAGRPFALSEWITVYPALYAAEGPFLVAAYGLGLQGWDASYLFQSISGTPADSAGNLPWGVWNGDAPVQLGQFPTLARMVLRGDVSEGPVVSVRRVSDENLATGTFDFQEVVTQSGDFKNFGGSVSQAVLARGRALVEFGSGPGASQPGPDPGPGLIRSQTGQLSWDPRARVVTVDTAGTQGFVGFAAGRTLSFADLSAEVSSPYASVVVTAAGRKETLADASSALISAVARNANRGMRVLTADGTTIVENGQGLVLEPVRLVLTFRRPVAQVQILDQDGRETGRVLPLQGGKVILDTGRDKTLYYRVVF